MKLYPVAVSSVLALALAACGSAKDASKENFAKAIDKSLATSCIGLNMRDYAMMSSGFPVALDEQQPNMFNTAESVKARNDRQFAPFDALVTAGLLSVSSGQVKPAFGSGSVPGKTYSLTDAGKKALKSPDSMVFCAGNTHVKEVVRYTEPGNAMGATVSEARYVAEATDVPAWVKTPAVQSAFPSLVKAVTETRERKAELVLQNDGWSAETSLF